MMHPSVIKGDIGGTHGRVLVGSAGGVELQEGAMQPSVFLSFAAQTSILWAGSDDCP
jgi:hypothetical protein